ncbi:MAG: hypothetical protein ACTIA5_01505 [Brachybacterium tyrofermentans]
MSRNRRRLGRVIRRTRRRHGWTRQQVLAERDRFQLAWDHIRKAAAPAIRHLLALIDADDANPKPQLIHNGRKPR